MSLDADAFSYVSMLLREQSGMVLEPGKEYLVETRVAPVAKQAGYASLSALINQLRGRPLNRLHMQVVEALMTSETQFFRDIHPFDALKTTILPQLIQSRSDVRQLKVWSAAAATGQEPYSIAMLLADSFPELANWIVQCTASDLSNEVLEIARQGCYRQSEVERGLPAPMLEKYFRKQGADWKIAEQIRARVDFRRINLVLPWPSLPLMDIVLMRNVLIYMDSETKKDILARVRKLLKPDGYLLLGSTETTINLDPGFEQIQMGKTMCFRLRT